MFLTGTSQQKRILLVKALVLHAKNSKRFTQLLISVSINLRDGASLPEISLLLHHQGRYF